MLDAATLAAGQERVEALLRGAHERLHPGCGWRSRADAISVDGWRWYGCADHATSTDSGVPSLRQTIRAQEALRVGKGTDR